MRILILLCCVTMMACQGKIDTSKDDRIKQLEGELAQQERTSRMLQEYFDKHFGGKAAELPSELGDLPIPKPDSAARALADSTYRSGLIRLVNGFGEKVRLDQLSNKGDMILIGDDLLFPPGAYKLTEKGVRTMRLFGKEIQAYPNVEVEVIGHTDDQPVPLNSLYYDNWDLSVLRATAVVRILVDAGVSPKRIRAAGRGPYAPLHRNDREAGRYLNRRTEIVLLRD
ncbi:MAG: flagellar motor protein MotB [Bacteroidia bacterium]